MALPADSTDQDEDISVGWQGIWGFAYNLVAQKQRGQVLLCPQGMDNGSPAMLAGMNHRSTILRSRQL